jgi:hypothetical protein
VQKFVQASLPDLDKEIIAGDIIQSTVLQPWSYSGSNNLPS